MKKTIPILVILILTLLTSSFAVRTCFNTTQDTLICFDADSSIYPQNIDLWEGHNEKYGVYITNPEEDGLFNVVKDLFDTGKIDVTKLGDETTFEFQSANDFYNLIQQNNALGNVTLFTQAELNQEIRERTLSLTNEVLGWTVTMLTVIIELMKIMFSVIIIIGGMYLFFRLIPFGLKKINSLIFRVVVGTKK